jgi:hypothetical protein
MQTPCPKVHLHSPIADRTAILDEQSYVFATNYAVTLE